VPQALANFFRTDNLIALRELALRFLADETEDELLEHLARYQTDAPWETSERILVAVITRPGTEAIIRRASRMAARIKADLHAVHVHMSDSGRSDDSALAGLRQLCQDVGADWTELEADDPAGAIIEFAKKHQITQIVIGSSQRGRLQELMGGGSIVRKVSRGAADAGIDVHIIARRNGEHPKVRGGAEQVVPNES
jgi:two-component system, OmpR family, sensor histidine kinase KdpD